jgi:AraC-like DNA-binding protein
LFRTSEGTALKRYVDRERCRVAESLVMYSDLNVGEIAESLNFIDIYSFSRFFKRQTGKSPRDFRKTLGPSNSSRGMPKR